VATPQNGQTTTLRLNNQDQGSNKVIKIRNFQQLFGDNKIPEQFDLNSRNLNDSQSEMVADDQTVLSVQQSSCPQEVYKTQQHRVLELQEAMQKQEIKNDGMMQPLFMVTKADHDNFMSESEYPNTLNDE
jgi:hypothetical protein